SLPPVVKPRRLPSLANARVSTSPCSDATSTPSMRTIQATLLRCLTASRMSGHIRRIAATSTPPAGALGAADGSEADWPYEGADPDGWPEGADPEGRPGADADG